MTKTITNVEDMINKNKSEKKGKEIKKGEKVKKVKKMSKKNRKKPKHEVLPSILKPQIYRSNPKSESKILIQPPQPDPIYQHPKPEILPAYPPKTVLPKYPSLPPKPVLPKYPSLPPKPVLPTYPTLPPRPVLPIYPTLTPKPLPPVQPFKSICIKFGEDKNDKTLSYNLIEDNIQALKSNCPVDHMWIPKPVKGTKKTYYLISARNGEALTQNPDDSINVEKMVHKRNQRWTMKNDGCNLYQIQNVDTRDYLALLNNDEVGVSPADGSKNVKSILFVIGSSLCEQ
jgi:hypothetical protein